jgi:hypothetical protein
MARLTSDQWRDMRLAWESDPRQGIGWLSAANGGPWQVTEEAIRLRRKAEGWTKRGTLGSQVEKAHLAADAGTGSQQPHPEVPDLYELGDPELGGSNSGPRMGGQEGPTDDELGASERVEKDAVQLRTELLDRHREEWKLARKLLYRAAREALKAKGFETAKFAKITAEALSIVQAGERKAWGLDAAQADLKNLSDDDLQRIAEGRMPA